jgi:hypothetical protein
MFVSEFENHLDMFALLLPVTVKALRFVNKNPVNQINQQFVCYALSDKDFSRRFIMGA